MTEFHNSHQEPLMNTVASYCSAHKESRKDVHTHTFYGKPKGSIIVRKSAVNNGAFGLPYKHTRKQQMLALCFR